ncbi:hypothetical protein [Nostoc sp.]|uniref:Uncharacterized protein n=1 Tax=Nostoc punctiforme NIES-2108 TaxID=1356359 RepID=A0A367R170_NOSPU|nr:hypothetical protein A6769_34915 [Nostoc punctiforme NIES-2108]
MSTIQRLSNGLNLIVKYDESAYVGIGSEINEPGIIYVEDKSLKTYTNMSELERHNMNSWGWKWDNGLWIIDLD